MNLLHERRFLLKIGLVVIATTLIAPAQSIMLSTQSVPVAGEVINRGDFNNDGILDLITVNNADTAVSVYLGRGDGTFPSPINTVVSGGASDLAVGDFDRDGKMDAAVVTQNGAIQVLLGNGDGTFRLARTSGWMARRFR